MCFVYILPRVLDREFEQTRNSNFREESEKPLLATLPNSL